MGLLTLLGAMRTDRTSGEPFPTVWETLNTVPVTARRGQVWLVGAAPGVGKSVFALTWMIWARARGIYHSADSGSRDQTARSVTILTDQPLADVTAQIDAGEEFDELLIKGTNHIRFDFNSGPSLEDIDKAVMGYAHLYGRWPEAVIVDNLMNVIADDTGEGSHYTQQVVLLFLQDLARKTGAMVLVLHHLTGEFEDGTKVPTLAALLGKAGKIPNVVLGLYRDTGLAEEQLGVAVLKNRGGPANAAGKLVVRLSLDLSKMSIKDPQPWTPEGSA